MCFTDVQYLQKCLPTWIDKRHKIHYDVPEQLSCLREGEKLLIQRLSVYVPVYHLYKGQTACKGHCAAFQQDISSIVNELPRLPEDVEFVQVIKKYKDSKGDLGEKQFVIRKSAVLEALYWLKEYNNYYKNVDIKEDRLDWIDGDEAELPSKHNQTEIIEDPDSSALHDGEVINKQKQKDTGPAYSQVVAVEEASSEGYIKQHGIICESFGNQPEKNFDQITSTIQGYAKQAYKKGQSVDFCYATSQQRNSIPAVTQDDSDEMSDNSKCSASITQVDDSDNERPTISGKERINYPKVQEKAIDEFDTSIDIFALAFPWLFPGGHGGPFGSHPTKLTLRQWLENCAYYEDGRFVKDKVFAFYALNFVNRHTNASQGKYYINKHNKEFHDLDSLQTAIQKGNTSWINKLIYFSSQIKGSVPYWREQRAKIHSWINYHIASGAGPPTLFITLSCAEYYWPDINRLLHERFNFKGVNSPLDGQNGNGKINSVKNVNDMTIVVQEYFQKRIENWLVKVGKPIFKIAEYWLRYEFAPTRGQIHCHMLAITDHNVILKQVMDECGSVKGMTTFLAQWMQQSFGMTAEMPQISNDGVDVDVELLINVDEKICNAKDDNIQLGAADLANEENNQELENGPCIDNAKKNHPASYNWSDSMVQSNTTVDNFNLLRTLQLHKCNTYCMRKRKIL